MRAAESDAAGAGELFDPVRADELLERVDLLGRADDLEDDRVRAEVGDAGVEDVARATCSSARRAGGAVTLIRASSRSIASPGSSSLTRRTLTSLCICFSICSSELLLAVDAQRDRARRSAARSGRRRGSRCCSRGARTCSRCASARPACPPRERTACASRHGHRLALARTRRGRAPRRRQGSSGSSARAGSTRQSTTAVRPQASASASVPSSSSSVSTQKPTAPYASASSHVVGHVLRRGGSARTAPRRTCPATGGPCRGSRC